MLKGHGFRITLAGLFAILGLLGSIGTSSASAIASSGLATSRTGKALSLLADLFHGRDQAVVAALSTQMARSLTSGKLASAVATYEARFGRYLGHDSPTTVLLGADTVVRVPLRMSRQSGEFRITFDPEGRVAGLYLLRTGVPL